MDTLGEDSGNGFDFDLTAAVNKLFFGDRQGIGYNYLGKKVLQPACRLPVRKEPGELRRQLRLLRRGQ